MKIELVSWERKRLFVCFPLWPGLSLLSKLSTNAFRFVLAKPVVLCIEDEPIHLLLRTKVLEKNGYTVIGVTNAAEALAALLQVPRMRAGFQSCVVFSNVANRRAEIADISFRSRGGIKSNVAQLPYSIQTSGMGLHETLVDFSFRAMAGTALVLAVIIFSFLGIPRRSRPKLTRSVHRSH